MREERKHILVVDDSETNRSLETLMLESEGYDVTAVSGGTEACGWLQDHVADMVITDLDMPGMNGLALTEAIRGLPALRDLPVIVMSGTDDSVESERALHCGASAFVGKAAMDFDRLLQLIRSLV